MTYSTVLALSSWTAEVQGYSQTVIRYTPIFLKAFSKTIAPVVIESVKGFSHHWFESECYWRQRLTNLAGITYNPLAASISAAHAELTSAEAQATYRHIRHITRETALDVLVVGICGVVAVVQGVEVAKKVYRMVKRVYDWVDARLNPAQPEPIILPTVIQFFAQDKAEEDLAALIEAVGHERLFLMQLDRLDADALALVCSKVDEAIAQTIQTKADHLKCDRTAEAQAIESPVAPAAAEAELVGALDVPGATGATKRQRKTGTSKAVEAKPKQVKGDADAVAIAARHGRRARV